MKIVVVGAGPSGMMAAISAKTHHPHAEVVLIERNKILGKKMRLTGGGRCNVSANVDESIVIQNTPKNGRFLYSSLSNFAPKDIITFFQDHGCELKEEDHHRMFPISDKSGDIVNTLHNVLVQKGVRIKLSHKVEAIDVNRKILHTSEGNVPYDKIILATGAKTVPNTGSDGNGYLLSQSLGHHITPLIPAEVPLVSNDRFIQEKVLQGLSFKDVSIKVLKGKKVVSHITHDLLITHFGLSGPCALRSSFEIQKMVETGPVEIVIDFFPDSSELDETHFNYQKRLIDYVATLKGDLYQNLRHFKMTIYDTRGFKFAFVTNGGVMLKEIDPKTMRSKINPDVSIVGELLDVSSFTGGYNITSALSTGYTAGKYILDIKS